MGWKNREIECKLLAIRQSKLPKVKQMVEDFVEKTYPDYEYIIGDASDWYWHAPKSSDGDFVRIRRNSNGAEITMKATDKDTNLDRVEIDLSINDLDQGKTLLKGLFGECAESVRKKYHVFFLENQHTNISVYQIRGDERVFIEIEARTKSRLRELLTELKNFNEDYQFSVIKSSIYDMFVAKTKMKEDNFETFLDNF